MCVWDREYEEIIKYSSYSIFETNHLHGFSMIITPILSIDYRTFKFIDLILQCVNQYKNRLPSCVLKLGSGCLAN